MLLDKIKDVAFWSHGFTAGLEKCNDDTGVE